MYWHHVSQETDSCYMVRRHNTHHQYTEDNFLLNRYCISMDQYHRSVLSAEQKFFDECDTGNGKIWFARFTLQSLLNCSACCGCVHQVWCTIACGSRETETRREDVAIAREADEDQRICNRDVEEQPWMWKIENKKVSSKGLCRTGKWA